MPEEQSLQIFNRPSYIGMIVALPFFLAAFLAYAFLSVPHGHGRGLLWFLASFFIVDLFYIIANYIPNNHHVSSSACISLVIGIIYFTYAKYCWVSVLCFDGWKHIGSGVGFWEKESLERKQRYWLYSVFAWGVPLLLSLLIFAISKSAPFDVWYNPGLDDEKCWLNDGAPGFVYLYLPTTLSIIADIVFLILIRRKVKGRGTTKLRGSRKKIKYKFGGYIQLLSVLFSTWLMNVITWVIIWVNGSAPNGYWYFMEFFDALIGFVTFIVSVSQKMLCTLFQKRFHEIRHNWRRKYGRSSAGQDGLSTEI